MSPILQNKRPLSPSVFAPSALLREARRQKGLPAADVPAVCILRDAVNLDVGGHLKSFAYDMSPLARPNRMFSCPGLVLAYAMNFFSVFVGTEGSLTSTQPLLPNLAMGWKSFHAWKPGLELAL